jgi:menaquinone-dependent protoporphyrinogen oxidase
VYGTRFGATAGTAEQIAKILHNKGLEVNVADAKTNKTDSISEYELIVVGSGMAMGNWTNDIEDFVKKHQQELGNKKIALFISSLKPIEEKKGKADLVNRIQKIGIDEKISKYSLKPISVGVFGGVVDYNKMNFIIRKAMETGYKADLQKFGFKETAPRIFDLRDWDYINYWAKELAQKAHE